MKIQHLLILLFLFIQQFSVAQINQIDSIINAWHDANQFDGTILIAHHDKVIYQKAVGTANRSWNIPIAFDSNFEIASISKSMIAGLILKLVEANKLKLNDPITKYFPNFKDKRASKITIHHMLTHTSGIGNYEHLPDSLKKNNFQAFKRMNFNRGDYADFLTALPLQFEVGERFYYSNFAYFLLAALIEQIEEKPFSVVFQEQIAVPLQMKNTFAVDDNQQIIPKRVIGYNWENEQFIENEFIDPTVRISIYSTVADLHKWAVAMTNKSFLPKHLLEKMQTNHLESINANYGYGWAVHPENSSFGMGNLHIKPSYFLHGGALEGFRSMLTVINDGEWIITHLSNVGNRTNELDLSSQIAQILTTNQFDIEKINTVQKEKLFGFWEVENVQVGEETMTPVAKWFKINANHTFESGNGWSQNSVGTWKWDGKAFKPFTTNGIEDTYVGLETTFNDGNMIWQREEDGMLVTVTLRQVEKMPQAPADAVQGLWDLTEITKDGKSILTEFDKNNQHYIFIRWDRIYVERTTAGQRSTGYWHMNGHRPNLTFLSHNSEQPAESWNITTTDDTLKMIGTSDTNKGIERIYHRLSAFPE